MKPNFRSEVTEIFDSLAAFISENGSEWHRHTSVVIHSKPISLFRHANGMTGMILPANPEEYERFRADHLSSAFSLTKLIKNGQKQIRLTLHDPEQEKVFSLLVDDILQILSADPTNAVQKTVNLVHHWRELFARRQPAWLSPPVEIGLLCELEVLYSLLQNGYPLETWRGPEGSAHDFELAGQSVECKASTITNGLRVSVNGITQLQSLPGKNLRLVVRKYEPDIGGPLSVPYLVNLILEMPEISRSLLLEKLDIIGGNPLRVDEDSEFGHYTPLNTFEFDVGSDFPRIKGIGAETRIQEVRYILDLSDPENIPGYAKEELILEGSRNR